jgi:hypothetical protein
MLNNLPPEIIHSIYASIESLSTAIALARCSKYLNTVWAAHVRTLDLVEFTRMLPRFLTHPNFACQNAQ